MKFKISFITLFAVILINENTFSQEGELIEISGGNFAEIYIRINPVEFRIEDIVKELWGNEVQINKEMFPNTYQDNCLIIKYPNGIGIRNGQITKSIMVKQDRELLKKVNEYFHGNEFIYCIMAYDNDYSFGYSYIKNGIIERYYFRDTSDKILKEYGLPFDSDLRAMNNNLVRSVDGGYIDVEMTDNGGWTLDYAYLPMLVTEYNMKEIIGYSLVNESKHLQTEYYKVNPIK